MSEEFPKIELLFDEEGPHKERRHLVTFKKILKKHLPTSFFSQRPLSSEEIEEKKEEFTHSLPIVLIESLPNEKSFSFFMICRSRENAFKFFFDVVSLWLVPGKRMNVPLMYAGDFRFKEFGQELYSTCEILVNVNHPDELAELFQNLPILEQEARLGLQSRFQAERITAIKGVSNDEKNVFIQTRLSHLIDRFPAFFEKGLITEMQHFLILCPENFEHVRGTHTLTKAIYSQYVFRKEIKNLLKENAQKRFVRVKLFCTQHVEKGEQRHVLSCVIGINLLQEEYEVINEKLILCAMQNYLPSLSPVAGSFILNRRLDDQICTIYLEVEKNTNTPFSILEKKHLKLELLVDLGDRISHLMHPIFMPRNEEEIMRNVLVLSNQVRYIRDLPQVVITFDHQLPGKLLFTVILVRICRPGELSIEEKFFQASTPLQYIHDRIKMLSMLRKKYSKEATIFQLSLESHKFLRNDQTIDLSRARQEVVDELTRIIGEFRDYNGGMISKQNEALAQLIGYFTNENINFNQLLLENLFYSLSPVVMRTVLPIPILVCFYHLLNECAHKKFFTASENKKIHAKEMGGYFYVWVSSVSLETKEKIERSVRNFPRSSTSLAHSYMHIYESHYCGFILHSSDKEERALLFQVLQSSIEAPNNISL